MFLIAWMDENGAISHDAVRDARDARTLISAIELYDNLLGLGFVVDTADELLTLLRDGQSRFPFLNNNTKTMFMHLKTDQESGIVAWGGHPSWLDRLTTAGGCSAGRLCLIHKDTDASLTE